MSYLHAERQASSEQGKQRPPLEWMETAQGADDLPTPGESGAVKHRTSMPAIDSGLPLTWEGGDSPVPPPRENPEGGAKRERPPIVFMGEEGDEEAEGGEDARTDRPPLVFMGDEDGEEESTARFQPSGGGQQGEIGAQDPPPQKPERPPLEWMSTPEVTPSQSRTSSSEAEKRSDSGLGKGILIPKLNLDRDDMRRRTASSSGGKGIVSFSARLPSDYERTMDSLHDDLPTPGRVTQRLLDTSRLRGHVTERASFVAFEKRVGMVEQDPTLRLMTYYDQAIMPGSAKGVTPKGELPVHGTSPLEVMFEFFAGRQQPGTAGMSRDICFDEVSKANVSMTFPELLRFVQVMFHRHKFSLSEIQWVQRRAKSNPYGMEEGNWHGDVSGDLNSLNFVEWLSCVVRLSLITFGDKGFTPEQCMDEVAKEFALHDINQVKKKIRRVARTNCGFGAWEDDQIPMEPSSALGINMRRKKKVKDFMTHPNNMLKLQHRLLGHSKTPQNVQWSHFEGPYISMVVPTTKSKEGHKFQLIVQNMAPNVFNISFRLENLDFMTAVHHPVRAWCASGMDCILDLTADVPDIGEYSGDIVVTGANGVGVVAICPVYIRAVGPTHYMSPSTLDDHFSRQGSGVGPMPFADPHNGSDLSVDVGKGVGRKSGVLQASEAGNISSTSRGPQSLVQPLKVTEGFRHTGSIPLHPTKRKAGKSTSKLSLKNFTPLSKEPVGSVYHTSGLWSPHRTSSRATSMLTTARSWLETISIKSSTPARLAI